MNRIAFGIGIAAIAALIPVGLLLALYGDPKWLLMSLVAYVLIYISTRPSKPKQDPRWAALRSMPSEPRRALSPQAAAKSERHLNIAFVSAAVVVLVIVILLMALEQSIR